MKKEYDKEIYKTKDEWLLARGIGGSDASAICYKSKWETPNDIYNKLVFKKEKTISVSSLMQDGTLAEDYIRNLFKLNFKLYKVTAPPKNKFWLFRRKDYPLMTCTPDGLIKSLEDGKEYGLEIKRIQMRTKATRELWENNRLPDQYYYQCLQYLVVRNDLAGVCLYAELDYYKMNEDTGKFEYSYSILRPYWVYREEIKDHITYLYNKEKEFIENNINTKTRPKMKM